VLDRRPWEPYGRIDFGLKQDAVPDTTENGCGSAWGDGRQWPLPRIDQVPPGREQGKTLALLGVRKGQLVDGESSGTDSEEDEEGSAVHKLAKIKHAIADLSQPVQVILNGRYQWEQGWENVSYCRLFKEPKVQEDILEPPRIMANAIGVMAFEAGAVRLPLPIQLLGAERESLEITERKDQAWPPLVNHELKFKAMFWEGLSSVFGTGAPASNAEISARLKSVTASWFRRSIWTIMGSTSFSGTTNVGHGG
jgi:hypothetical protein